MLRTALAVCPLLALASILTAQERPAPATQPASAGPVATQPASTQPATRGGAGGWRGDGSGRYIDARPPLQWDRETNVRWKTSLGSWSNATPLLVGDRLFACAEPGKLFCLDADTGKILWQADQTYPGANIDERQPRAHGANGYTSPTPVSCGQFVYWVSGNGVASKYTLDGKRVWMRLVERPDHQWGQSGSPVLAEGRLIFSVRQTFALDVQDGSTAWQAGFRHNWGSPIVFQVGGQNLVAMPSGEVLLPRTGKVVADKLGFLEYNAPIVQDGVLYYISNSATAWKLPERLADERLELQRVWERRLKGDRYYASPVYAEGLIYAVTRGQQLSVIRADTGEDVYEERLGLKGDSSNQLYSSPTLAGGMVFVTSEPGETIAIAPGKSFEVKGRSELALCRSCPIFVGNRVYLRASDAIWCFESR